MNKKNTIFFDGHCNLCNWAVNFVIKHDQNSIFYFAPLQGKTAKSYALDEENSVVFVNESGEIFKASDAAIEILVRLFFISRAFYLLKIFPRSLRDFVYNLVAKNRYKLFGKRDTCRMPSPDEKKFFLD